MADNNLFVNEEDLTWMPSKEDRALAVLCYVHFLFIVPFLLQKDSEFLKFHMRQWGLLYVLFFFSVFVLSILILLTWSLRFLWLEMLILVAYTWVCIFVWYKAYFWKKYELGFLKAWVEKLKNIMDKEEENKQNNDSNY